MTLSKETREAILAVVLFVMIGVLIVSINHVSDLLEHSQTQEEEADVDRLRAEYQRVLLGCNTAGAQASEDPDLITLCDGYLDDLKAQLDALEDG